MRARNKLNVKQVASLKQAWGLHRWRRTLPPRSAMRIEVVAVSFSVSMASGGKWGWARDLDVTLNAARVAAAAARQMVLAGENPQVARKAAKGRVAAKTITFGEFAHELIDSIEDGFKNFKHRQQWRNSLTTHAPRSCPSPSIKCPRKQVLAALQPIWLTKAETASRVRGRIERVLDAAKAKGLRSGENPAIWKGHLELLLAKQTQVKVKHHAALPFQDMAKFMIELAQRSAPAARALEFTILTAARSGETRGMRWSEVDFDAKIWTVPGRENESRR